MSDEPIASKWAQATFGQEAAQLVQVIPRALHSAHERAKTAHLGVQTVTLEAYGHGLHAAQYESLAGALAEVAGTSTIRLNGRDIVLLKDQAFYPLRMPKRGGHLKRVSALRRRLFDRHGPDPAQEALDLVWEEGGPDLEEIREGASDLPDNIQLIVLAYVCTVETGLVELRWGHAELLDDGSLRWHDSEVMQLSM
ncbi:hypothetical protein [Streptacidiphilus sp. EB103A]|uniref:hypothetical protein n=1 Tax=Streptacidiphilus sp. EB103A TaxID=3156275 RepID=UPI003515855A